MSVVNRADRLKTLPYLARNKGELRAITFYCLLADFYGVC